jgi:hypothetical protein
LERSSRGLVSPFLLTYSEQLRRRKEILNAALASVAQQERESRPDGAEEASEALLEALKRQTSTILMISSRIAKIKGATREIGPKLRKLLQTRPQDAQQAPDEIPDLLQSELERVKRDYEEFWIQRNRDLDKRHTDPAPFKDPPSSGTAGRFGTPSRFGTGSFASGSGLGSFGKPSNK